ncbi:formylglycine-generating enzyme family protein [Denitratisoma sp. DHT3]|uniref:formylglycine-generating enzyme family protein n=1 Tax=Denitratisoma sp. DHT3 TaxID=1981880 RepID=UPI0011A4CA52|nr:formylglycine-generating enzyme family protein [Denitratisoma sp. DHT3]
MRTALFMLLGGCLSIPLAWPAEGFRECPVCPEMTPIVGGHFEMGSSEPEADSDEQPPHVVTVKRFAMGRHEVTVAQFRAFVEATAYRPEKPGCWASDAEDHWISEPRLGWFAPGFPQGEDFPVVCVSWDDAQSYVRWLSAKTGARYRLPSEAEWEYAAQAGHRRGRFWPDEKPAAQCVFANGADLSARDAHPAWEVVDCRDGYGQTSPVGHFRPNAWGLYDMLGNAWEWVEDCRSENYDGAPSDGRAWTDTGQCHQHGMRGGSWYYKPLRLRIQFRLTNDTRNRSFNVGFRVARDLAASPEPR